MIANKNVMLLHIFSKLNQPNVFILFFNLMVLVFTFDGQADEGNVSNKQGESAVLFTDAPEAREVLVSIKPIDDSDLLHITASIRIAAERMKVWDVLTSCEQAMEYVPDIRSCKVLQSGVDSQGVPFDITKHHLKPYFFLPGVDSIFRADYQKPKQVSFYRQGGDMAFFKGEWRFVDSTDDETILFYDATVDLHRRLGQRSEQRILQRDLPQMLKKLRELVEQESP